MAFWSGERLEKELGAGLVVPFKKGNLDCASYRLSVGNQVFATSDEFAVSSPSSPIIQVLKQAPDHTLKIQPGQFAFLLTDEIVNVPSNAIALISIRANYKFKGLINVSGFHVDPGWSGKLLFSVYNAGPKPMVVEYGEPMFLIVYAELDQVSSQTYNGSSKGQNSIKPSLMEGMDLQVFSPMMLQRKVEDLTNKIDSAEKSILFLKSVSFGATTAFALLFALAALAPNSPGVWLAGIIQNGGYEMRLKQPDSSSPSQTQEAALLPIEKPAKQTSTVPPKKQENKK